jgi:cytosolic iron-sulfur protein assembly protein CIAO1
VRSVDWRNYGESSSRKKKRRRLTLATGSFDANVGIWEYNPSHEGGTSLSDALSIPVETEAELEPSKPNQVPGAFDTSPSPPQEVPMNEIGDEDEPWLFSTLLTGPDSEIKSISFSPPHFSASLLATSSRDKSVWIWEEVEDEEWETVAVLQEHTGDVKCVDWCAGAVMPKSKSMDVAGAGAGTEEHDEETRVVGAREVLASSSYDDTIRLWRDIESEGDWSCIAVLTQHTGTVWTVKFERHINTALYPSTSHSSPSREELAHWEPRLISCSDDLTVRIWKRELSEAELEKKATDLASGKVGVGGEKREKLPSIIRPTSTFETWTQEAVLPSVHVRSVYSVDWSARSGLVVSAAGDGVVAVYKEFPFPTGGVHGQGGDGKEGKDGDGDVAMNGTTTSNAQSNSKSTWKVVALMEAAHDEFEINHVCFALRRDKDRRYPNEEVIISTADDGDVRIWTLPEELCNRD